MSIFLSFLITLLTIPLLRRVAYKYKILDIPDGRIKKHEKPVPYLGGLAIYLGLTITLILAFPIKTILPFLLGLTFLLVLGLIDDLVTIRLYQKFLGQICGALLLLTVAPFLKYLGLTLTFFYFPDGFWNILLSLFWILSVMNAFNLVDVMDGLAPILAITISSSFLIFSLYFNQPLVSIILSSFLGAVIAFLYFNFPPARIYLGDSGSLFLGGFLAVIPFMLKWDLYNPYGYLIPIVILAIPLLEGATLIIIRIIKKLPFYYGSPHHFSIYLQKHGFSKREILLFITGISIFLFIISFLFALNTISLPGLILFNILFLLFWMWSIFFLYKSNF